MWGLRSLAVALLVTPALTGCLTEPEVQGAACSNAEPRPLTVEQVESALNSHGIEVGRSEPPDLCSNKTVAVLDNGSAEETWNEDGIVICTVGVNDQSAPFLPSKLQSVQRIEAENDARLLLANLDCTLDYEGDQREEQLRQLHAALRTLERDL